MKLGIEQFKKVTAELGSAKVDQMIADERRALDPKAPPPKPAPAATPMAPKVTTTSEEKVGTKVRQSPLLGEAMKRRLKELRGEQEALAHELVALERKVKEQASQEKHARAQEEKLKRELSAKEASAKRAVGEKTELAKENTELKEKLKKAEYWKQGFAAAEREVANLTKHIQQVEGDSHQLITNLKSQLAEARRASEPAKAADARPDTDTEALAKRTEAFEQEKAQLTALLAQVQKELSAALEENTELDKIYSTALFKAFKNADKRVPGFMQSFMQDNEIPLELKEFVQAVFE